MILALAGLAGSGKTTAIGMLSKSGFGASVYVGQIVTDEVARRGLKPTPANERAVRKDMREREGMHVLAERALPAIGRLASNGNALIDAIYNREEYDAYAAVFGRSLKILGISASFDLRAKRLADRVERPISLPDLKRRDEFEVGVLGLDVVLSIADHRLANEGSLDELEDALKDLLL